MSNISENIIRNVVEFSKKINRGIGCDTFLFRFKNKKYVLRAQNSNPHSLSKLSQHLFFLRLLSKENFVQDVIQDGKIDDRFYFITNYIKGNNKDQLTRRSFCNLNKSLQRLHQYRFKGHGRLDIKTKIGEFSSWGLFLGDIIKKIKKIEKTKQSKFLKTEVDNLYKCFINLDYLICNRKANSLIHFDLNLENILFYNKNIFILDWENAIVGDPLLDYAIMDNFWFNIDSKIIRNYINKDERALFDFYKKLFLLREISYKKKYKMRILDDINKFKKFPSI